MDPIHSWLDANELRQLAQSLLPAKPDTLPTTTEAGFNEQFVGFTAAADASPAPTTPIPAFSAPPLTAPNPSPAVVPATRTADYELSADELFILDATGKAVHGAKLLTAYHTVAAELIQNARRRGLPKGHVHMKIGPGRVLELIPLPQPKEQWIAGLIVPNPLDPDCISSLSAAISQLTD